MEIITSKEQKEKRLKKSEQSLRALWYLWEPISRPIYMHCRTLRKRRQRGKGQRDSQVMATNFPDLMKDMNINVQKLNKLQVRLTQEIHSKKQNDRTLKTSDREILESHKREMNHHVQGILNKIQSRFLIRNLEARRLSW